MKKLIFCFDGTCNDPSDSVQTVSFSGDVSDSSITNVLKLHLMFGGDLSAEVESAEQMSFYYSGVGTYGGWWKRLMNMLVAPENEDVGNIINKALSDLARNYRKGDKVFLFGFSRGAAIARRFASVVERVYPALGVETPRFRFVGVFDTVAAINKPNLFRQEVKPASDVVFENMSISPLIDEALHLVALDERRTAFLPTLMNRDARVTEVWLPGAHADVGGGYHFDGLSDVALRFMLDEIERRGLGIDVTEPENIKLKRINEHSRTEIQRRDILIQENYLGQSHQQHAITRIKKRFMSHREPRVNVNDKHSVYPPIIHRCVFDRMRDSAYRCAGLDAGMVNRYTGKRTDYILWKTAGARHRYSEVMDAVRELRRIPESIPPGERRSLRVYANQPFSPTHILLEAGAHYRFALDEDQMWYDGDMEATTLGWTPRSYDRLNWFKRMMVGLAVRFRRVEDAEWFELCGCLDQDDRQSFRVADFVEEDLVIKEDAVLCLFANDSPKKYDNNLGVVEVSIERVS